METLVVGTKAPDISLKDAGGNQFELKAYDPKTRYVLLVFWSADCSHCKETVDALYPWQKQAEIQQKLSVVAISLDESETEVQTWEKKIIEFTGWKHMRATEGVRSKVASDYFVLATPVMILLDAATKEIVSLPASFPQLKAELK